MIFDLVCVLIGFIIGYVVADSKDKTQEVIDKCNWD